MAERIDCDKTGQSNFPPTFFDWEDVEWYLDYFEYFLSYTSFCWVDNRPRLIEAYLDPFPETMMKPAIYQIVLL